MAMLKVERGNIVRLQVDAIVNAANEFMLGGGGVDGAIHEAAGPRLLEACRAVPEVRPGVRCPVGEARITDGFDLPARYVIHTVGPVWRDGRAGEDEALASCYRASLGLAEQHGVQSIAFPAISCGIFRFPVARACGIAVREIRQHLSRPTSISTVILVAFDSILHEALRVAAGDVSAGGV
jgi:O-acetyl-ADP-ribose deacetylase (regulator of RNase III)